MRTRCGFQDFDRHDLYEGLICPESLTVSSRLSCLRIVQSRSRTCCRDKKGKVLSFSLTQRRCRLWYPTEIVRDCKHALRTYQILWLSQLQHYSHTIWQRKALNRGLVSLDKHKYSNRRMLLVQTDSYSMHIIYQEHETFMTLD